MKLRILTVAVALFFTNCGGSSTPTSPSTSTSPPSPTATQWMVTHAFVSVAGPDNCWVRQQRASLTGVVFPNLTMSITRSNGSITVQSEWFQTYTGTYNGTQFSASGTESLEGGGTACDGSTYEQRPGVSNLSGLFSNDDRELTASEVNSYVLTTGEVVSYTWGWKAVRRN